MQSALLLSAAMAAEAAGRDDATVRPAECNEMEEWVRCPFGKVCYGPFANMKKIIIRIQSHQAIPAALDALAQRGGKKSQGAHHRSRDLQFGTVF